jgi:hypothetical protein
MPEKYIMKNFINWTLHLNIVREIKSQKMKFDGVCSTYERRHTQNFSEKSEAMTPLGKPCVAGRKMLP